MTLFSLYELHGREEALPEGLHRHRQASACEATIEGLGIEVPPNELFDCYYGLIDFEFWARKYLGDEIVQWMKQNVHPLDIVFRLAEDHGIVLLERQRLRSAQLVGAGLVREPERPRLRRHRPRGPRGREELSPGVRGRDR